MTDPARDYALISWDKREVKVRGFSSANRGKATVVKIELETSDPYALATLFRELQDAQRPAPKKPEPPKPSTRTAPLALPAPRLRLEDQRHG